MTVPASTTGMFPDGLSGINEMDPTVELRFDLLYVDYQPSTGPMEAGWEDLSSGRGRSTLGT